MNEKKKKYVPKRVVRPILQTSLYNGDPAIVLLATGRAVLIQYPDKYVPSGYKPLITYCYNMTAEGIPEEVFVGQLMTNPENLAQAEKMYQSRGTYLSYNPVTGIFDLTCK